MQTPYDVLGVPPDADAATIRAAFRNAAKIHHPDLHAGDRAAEQRFRQIVVARNALKDPEWRAFYRYQQLRNRQERRHWTVTLASCALSALVSGSLVSALHKDPSPARSFSASFLPASASAGFPGDAGGDFARGSAGVTSAIPAFLLAASDEGEASARHETVTLADAAFNEEGSEAGIPAIAETAGTARVVDPTRYFSTAAEGAATLSSSWPLDLASKQALLKGFGKGAKETGKSRRLIGKRTLAAGANRSIGRTLPSIFGLPLGSAPGAPTQRHPIRALANAPIARPAYAPRNECGTEAESLRGVRCGTIGGAGG